MKIGLIGLGRMGNALAYRLVKARHTVIGFDSNAASCKEAARMGVMIEKSPARVAQSCSVVWLMVPAGEVVDTVIDTIAPEMKAGSIIVDGGNSFFKDTIVRAKHLEKKQIIYLDCGTSGGLNGKTAGFSLMIGGDKKAFQKLRPIFRALAAPKGYGYMGPSGAGHYVKMVHNGIEYALLQAYSDGFSLLKNGSYKNLDLELVARTWQHGSVIRSWIVELLGDIFKEKVAFDTISGAIGENKTGAWTSQEAHKYHIPVDLIDRSLEIREWSRTTGGNFATKLVALLRNKFGGHPVQLIVAKAKKKGVRCT